MSRASGTLYLTPVVGQVYHTLLQEREDKGITDVAISRLEQISPFPYDLVRPSFLFLIYLFSSSAMMRPLTAIRSANAAHAAPRQVPERGPPVGAGGAAEQRRVDVRRAAHPDGGERDGAP